MVNVYFSMYTSFCIPVRLHSIDWMIYFSGFGADARECEMSQAFSLFSFFWYTRWGRVLTTSSFLLPRGCVESIYWSLQERLRGLLNCTCSCCFCEYCWHGFRILSGIHSLGWLFDRCVPSLFISWSWKFAGLEIVRLDFWKVQREQPRFDVLTSVLLFSSYLLSSSGYGPLFECLSQYDPPSGRPNWLYPYSRLPSSSGTQKCIAISILWHIT